MHYDTNFFEQLDCSPELIPESNIMDVYNHMQDCIYTKDVNSRYCFVNKHHMNVGAFNHLDSFSGKIDDDLCWQEYGDLYKVHDQDAMNEMVYRQLALAKTNNGESIIVQSFKKPIYNDLNIPVGVFCVSQTYQYSKLHEFLASLRMPTETPLKIVMPESLLNILNQSGLDLKPLTVREIEVLFFLVQGKSPKTIANILALSVRTVNHHIGHIKEKWNCYSTEAIHTKAYESGFFNCIPSTLFNASLLFALKL